MTKEKLKQLGWQFDGYWANRALFSKKDTILEGFVIFEHNGDWGIMDPYAKGYDIMDPYAKGYELIYCQMTDDELKQYIDYVNRFENIMDHPKDYTFFEYLCIEADIRKFVKNKKDRAYARSF